MILNIDNDIHIDMDKVSAILPRSKYIVIDGTKVTILKDEYMNIIIKAFQYIHKSYTYDKNLKRIK